MKQIALLLVILLLPPIHLTHAQQPAIKFTGFGTPELLVKGVQQPGETRADGAVPSHPNALRLSRDVWMILFGTRMFTGTDDDRSIYCQLRRGQVNGPLIRERVLTLEGGRWEARKDRDDIRKVQGTPTGFGVPKGALIHGRPAANANVFMVVWYTYPKLRVAGRNVDPKTAARNAKDPQKTADSKLIADLADQIHVEHMQFRLNDAEDDIEILQPVQMMRQVGYENEKFPCQHAMSMNRTMMPPKPVDATRERWMEIDQFGNRYPDNRLAAVLFEFNHHKRLYEWTQTGPLSPVIPGGSLAAIEASLNRIGDEWIICARGYGRQGQTIWYRVKDPLQAWTDPIVRDEPGDHAHKTIAICADGVLRVFAHDRATSPRHEHRNPLYCWDVNLTDFTVTNRRLVFDAHAAGLPIKYPFVDCPKVLPAGNGKQYLGFRVLSPLKWHEIPNYEGKLTPEEFNLLGGHVVEMKYDGPVPDEWEFENRAASKSAAQ